MPTLSPAPKPVRARFPADLHLPAVDLGLFEAAAEAVRREYRTSVRWKRLRCRNVEPLATGDGTIFVLDVGHAIEFDWTWEGAVAFRPPDPAAFEGGFDTADDFAGGRAVGDGVWAAEVVEVDETNGRLFVSVPSLDDPPCRGTFFVRPFEFLAFLHTLFCQPTANDSDWLRLRASLPARLHATRGGVHPPLPAAPRSGLPDLGRMWGHSWGVLWGPPGCGKTTTLGRQVAACLADPAERILVVSTTNKATDAAALATGRAAHPAALEEGRVLRIGKGADYPAFDDAGLTGMLRGTETELLREIAALTRRLEGADRSEDRAVLRDQIQDLRRVMKDRAFNVFVSPEVRAVVATAFKAVTLLTDPAIRAVAAGGEAPFTTVIIDEAGLVPRAVVAGLSLLAARRVVVVGDAKQLAPISKVSRVLPTAQAGWLASSGLTHLQRVAQAGAGVHLLREQHRMHPDVSRVVSGYQYEGALADAPTVTGRASAPPGFLAAQPRAVWYVLDEDGQDLPAVRAERGPGNRSWVRPATREVLAKLFADRAVRQARGLFITPFKAQARDVAGFLAAHELDGWSAGTVHGRQGTEADVVVFDTVNAGSCGWPYDEWKRLVNVGISRAREFVLVLASRAEMGEPYLRPLADALAPRVLRRSRQGPVWVEVPAHPAPPADPPAAANPDLLGSQIALRKALRPILSAEQQRLCGYALDGKPRLVRGVAGSGKTVVLAHWLQRTVRDLADRPDARVWAVYANRSLQRLIADTVEEAWRVDGAGGEFPWDRVELHHAKDILEHLLPEVGLRVRGDDFDYDAMAAAYLGRRPFERVTPRCHAMFIDEAQDMGPNLLKLLSALVEPSDPAAPRARAVNIFYDNAQNIYGRGTPKWSDMGLDMRGRSTVMKESFRSTRPITEFALNVLYRLQSPDRDPDHKELVERGLVEPTLRGGERWWVVRFNQVEGPAPQVRKFPSLDLQIEAIGTQLVGLVRDHGVKPGDICVLYNGKNIKFRLEQVVGPMLRAVGSRLAVLGDRGWDRPDDAVLVSTVNSYKGYDSEFVIVAGAEQFVVKDEVLASKLYVAMTRARSGLAIYAYARKTPDEPTHRLLVTLEDCLNGLLDRPRVDPGPSHLDDFEDVAARLGASHRAWLADLWGAYLIQHDPILAGDGEILAEPVFWFQTDDRVYACFGTEEPRPHALHKLEDHRIEVLRPGRPVPGSPT